MALRHGAMLSTLLAPPTSHNLLALRIEVQGTSSEVIGFKIRYLMLTQALSGNVIGVLLVGKFSGMYCCLISEFYFLQVRLFGS